MVNPLRSAAVIAALMLVWCHASTAEEQLPFELELPSSPVILDLFDARVLVAFQPEEQPLLRATGPPGESETAATLDVRQEGGGVFVERPALSEGRAAPPVTVELVLGPTQNLRVVGDRLSVTVEAPEVVVDRLDTVEPSKDGPGESSLDPAAAPIDFQVTNSQIDVTNASDISLISEDTVFQSLRSTGSMSLQIGYGSAVVRRHAGAVRLASSGGQATVEDLDGSIEFQLEGGDVEIRTGGAAVQGTANGGRVSLAGWTGRASLTARNATLELRDSKIASLQVAATESAVEFDGVHGAGRIQLEGGDLSARDGAGNYDVKALAGAGASFERHRGSLSLTLQEDSSARLVEVTGTLKAKLDGSELDLSGRTTIELSASDSRVVVAGGARINTFQAERCDVELDLRVRSGRELILPLGEQTYATVLLATPCSVRVRGPAATGSQVDVTGCELQFQGTGRWAGRRTLDMDGRRPFHLVAELEESANLRVEGMP